MDDSQLDDVITRLRSVQNTYAAKRAALKAELDKADLEYKRADRALRLLTGEGPTARADRPATPKRKKPSGISEEKLVEIREAVLRYASDHEEFRQIDIRNMPGLAPGAERSGTMALAFEVLRQDGTIRLARQNGTAKWFRLTRQAMNGDG